MFVEKFSGQMWKIRISEKKNFEFPKRCVPFFFLNFFFSSFVDHGDNDIEHCTIGMFDFTSFLFFFIIFAKFGNITHHLFKLTGRFYNPSAKSIELSWKKSWWLPIAPIEWASKKKRDRYRDIRERERGFFYRKTGATSW